jgi:hypothetical protein
VTLPDGPIRKESSGTEAQGTEPGILPASQLPLAAEEPMTAPAQDAQGTGVNGKDFDSYKNQLEDNFYYNPFVLLLTLIGIIFPAVLPYRACFPFHNYRQVHVFQNAITAGWNAPPRDSLAGKLIFPQIPDCPILWQDVSHYWIFGAAIGILMYEFLAHIRIVILIFALFQLVSLGKVSIEDAYKIALQQMTGVSI